VEEWRNRIPSLTVLDASGRRGASHARNRAIEASRGSFLVICDADDVVAPDWLEHIVAALDEHPMVAGYNDVAILNEAIAWEGSGLGAAAKVPVLFGFLPFASTNNLGMWRSVHERVAGFHEGRRRCEDVDFSWRAWYSGIEIHYEPRAVVHYRFRTTPLAAWKRSFGDGFGDAWLYRRYGKRGMQRDSAADIKEAYRWIFQSLPSALRPGPARGHWAAHTGARVGRLLGSVRQRVLFL
jgi:glycosyltransferase involved in cell wall biosynthesis